MTPESLSELPSALARLDCSGAEHTIRWERGDSSPLITTTPKESGRSSLWGGRVADAWTCSGRGHVRRRTSACYRSSVAGREIRSRPRDSIPAVSHPLDWRPAMRSFHFRAQRGGWVSTAPRGTATPSRSAMPGVQGLPSTSSSTFEGDAVLLAGLGQELTVRMVATVTAAFLDNPIVPKQ